MYFFTKLSDCTNNQQMPTNFAYIIKFYPSVLFLTDDKNEQISMREIGQLELHVLLDANYLHNHYYTINSRCPVNTYFKMLPDQRLVRK